jgi:hypothetical protein
LDVVLIRLIPSWVQKSFRGKNQSDESHKAHLVS